MSMKKIDTNKIVISTSQRFVGEYRNHRISIAGLGDNTSKYDYDIRNTKDHMCVVENIEVFDDIGTCLEHCVAIIDNLCDGMQVRIEQHTQVDKSFDMILENLDFHLRIDYDDVDHAETDAVVQYLSMLIQRYWNDEEFRNIFKTFVIREWNEANLRDDSENDLEAYLESRLPKTS